MRAKAFRLVFAAALVFQGTARAGTITAESFSGAGGTVVFNFDPSRPNAVGFTANFTSNAPIDVTLTVDSPGVYVLSPGLTTISPNVTDSTGSDWLKFQVDLANAPAGSMLLGGQTFDASNSGGGFFFGDTFAQPSPTEIIYGRGTGVVAGGTVGVGPGASIAGTGATTFDIILNPIPGVLTPEPSTLLSAGAGFAALALWRVRRRR